MANYVLCRWCYHLETKSKWTYMGNYLSELWKYGEWKLILPIHVFFTGKNYYEPLIDQAHVETAYSGVEITLQYASERYQWQSSSARVQSCLASCDTCQRVKQLNKTPLSLVTTLDIPDTPFSDINMHFGQLTTVFTKCSTINSKIATDSNHMPCMLHWCTIPDWCSPHHFLIPIPSNFKAEQCSYTDEV